MTSPTRSTKSTSTLEEHVADAPSFRPMAHHHPAVPDRLTEIVRWIDNQMRDAGLKLLVAKDDAARASWQARYGLTPAETKLAAHLLNGGTPATYAAEHRLSPHTVRNHLRSIYAKTNTNRQVSLLQLLLRASGKNP
jgi:DNA-binding CsgD family transcriptional regulator